MIPMRGTRARCCAYATTGHTGPAPQVAAVEPDQFGSLSLVARVKPPIVWLGQGLLRLAALVPSGSVGVGTGYPTQASELSYLYFERLAAAAPATALARSSCPF